MSDHADRAHITLRRARDTENSESIPASYVRSREIAKHSGTKYNIYGAIEDAVLEAHLGFRAFFPRVPVSQKDQQTTGGFIAKLLQKRTQGEARSSDPALNAATLKQDVEASNTNEILFRLRLSYYRLAYEAQSSLSNAGCSTYLAVKWARRQRKKPASERGSSTALRN